jgi:thiol-disulfide isomerase/thioredoxin
MNFSKALTYVLIVAFFGYLMFLAPKVDRSPPPVTISGVVTNPIGDTIKFNAPDSTYITTLDTTTGEFSISFDFDTAANVSFFHGVESTRMFIQEGDEIHLTIDTEQFDESITYRGSDESSFYAWQYLENENSDMPSPFNVADDELEQWFDDAFGPFLDELDSFRSSNPIFYKLNIDAIVGSKEHIIKRRAALAALPQPGDAPINFTYPDAEGNEISLSDFVGSVVFVDVWATWCGPCRAEIPYLIDLEEEYRDENVTFIGLSLDKEKDRQVWLDMMEEKGMHGVQLFADGWGGITEDYAINGIPRFMLFDSNGMVADLDAPRPSSDDIRPALNALLSTEEAE